MNRFTERVKLSPLRDGKRWEVLENFGYYIGNNDQEMIIVPRGFITDLASVPRVFHSFIPPWGKYGQAAILHDYLYETKKYPKKIADKIFYDAMGVLRVPKWKRTIMYLAVKWFGEYRFNK